MSHGRFPYLPNGSFIQPNESSEVNNPYVMDSRLLQDLNQRSREPVYVATINLTTAGSLLINQSGFHFVAYGHDGTDIKTVDTTALINVWINADYKDPGQNPFPAKHARGFSGPFKGLYIEWPAQNGVYVDVIVYKAFTKPWIDGESCT